ncbi:hypothetical protein BDA99DRAFT_543056 [Phascolomyces articulosus]|uniref:Uncharacterized protein n=1 Tax=Phascolomyces articulosus TaxID=60185 RepID=A0AAD5JY29_9FUNG|nr:hypothetical protein BDA99DRAFT_543056 [Phascolomyces articulosus]
MIRHQIKGLLTHPNPLYSIIDNMLHHNDLLTSFTTCTRDISFKTKLKAIEWIDIMRYVVPTIIAEHIKDKDAKNALLSLSCKSNIIFKKTITEHDLKQLETNVWKWLNYLRHQVNQNNLKGSVFTITNHYLQYLSAFITDIGLPRWCAAFAMERALGEVKRKVKGRSKQGVKAGNIIIKLAAKRYYDQVTLSPAKSASKKNNTLIASDELIDPEIWDLLWNTTINELNANDHEIIGSSFRLRDESRHVDYFVKMVINVWKTNLDSNRYPYLAPKAIYHHAVIDVGDIRSIAGIYTTTAGVCYIVYPEIDLLTKKNWVQLVVWMAM